MKKTIIKLMSILETSKTIMYEFWYEYIKPKYQGKANLYHVDTDTFTVNRKTADVYKNIANDVEKRFDISNYDIERPLSGDKTKK